MNMINLLGLVASIVTTVSFLPQVILAWKTKRTKDISFLMYLIIAIGAVLWVIYGVLLQAPPIYITNGLIFTFVLSILYLKVKNG